MRRIYEGLEEIAIRALPYALLFGAIKVILNCGSAAFEVARYYIFGNTTVMGTNTTNL